MTDQHRALPDQWATLKRIDGLRARIEALEAGATCPHIVSSDEGTSYCRLAKQSQDKLDRLIELDRAKPAPAGSLVDRVADAIYRNGTGDGFREEARAAIREVAAWFRRGDAGAGSAWTVAADVLDAVLQQDGDR